MIFTSSRFSDGRSLIYFEMSHVECCKTVDRSHMCTAGSRKVYRNSSVFSLYNCCVKLLMKMESISFPFEMLSIFHFVLHTTTYSMCSLTHPSKEKCLAHIVMRISLVKCFHGTLIYEVVKKVDCSRGEGWHIGSFREM